MKTITKTLSLFGLGLLITFSACKKEAGPVGPQGPSGKDGNANVVLYKFAGNDFSIGIADREITMSLDSFNGYTWLAYFKHNNQLTYAIPGFGVDGISDYRFFYNSLSSPSHVFSFRNVSGPGEAYDSIKVVGIQIGKVIGKKDDLPNIDFNDYNAVKAYYGLKD